MARLTIHSPATAPAESRPLLEAAEARNGFIPNLLGVRASAPTALETYLTVSGINARASFDLAERETVQITAATTHGCDFCVAGHTAIARKGGLPDELIEGLRAQETLDDARLEAAQAAMLHQGARGYLRTATAQRRLREAYFIAIVTPALKHLRREIARLSG